MYLVIPWEVMMLRMGLQLRYEDIKYLDSVFMQGAESEGHLLVVLRLGSLGVYFKSQRDG